MHDEAGYVSKLSQFQTSDPSEILVSLKDFIRDYSPQQEDAWREEIAILQTQVAKILPLDHQSAEFNIILEYRLPYENRRPDVIVLCRNTIIVLEFKSKESPTQADLDQVSAYARNLSSYHKECHERTVHPLLILTRTQNTELIKDGVTVLSPERISDLLIRLAKPDNTSQLSLESFLANDSYRPLPTLVQAARELFESGTVRDIWRARAVTDPAVETIATISKEAATSNTRHLVLVTGVPGSGKTLVGMRSVHTTLLDELSVKRNDDKPTVPGLYLTGNQPLAQVLQHELRNAGGGGQTFVRHIKSYLDRYVGHPERIPPEHLLVFDEAQRAFNASKVADTHKKWPFEWIASEPELFVETCNRMPEWSVLVGLIGSGQEIHVGEEDGLIQWRRALENSPNNWVVHLPRHLEPIFSGSHLLVSYEETLNLEVEIRFHYTQKLHELIDAMLSEVDEEKAALLSDTILRPKGHEVNGMKIYVTRDQCAAKTYLNERYSEFPQARYGIIASSRDKDLPSFGIHNDFLHTRQLRVGPWFSDGTEEKTSCRALDQVASEFACQGLELDMALVAWGTDLILSDHKWTNKNARVYRAQGRATVQDPFQMRINAYRVLLTRGRDGSIIYVPPLNELDETYEFFISCGIPVLAV